MTAEDRETLEDFCRSVHGAYYTQGIRKAIRAALDEIDRMDPPMPTAGKTEEPSRV